MVPERRSLKFYQADVFSSQPFGGNPVAVFPDAQGLGDDQLQQIAREMNLSESVFVFPPTNPAAVVRLRIFTPTQEIPFAGHPVVGTMHVLAQLGLIATPEPVTRVVQECNIGLFPVDLLMRDGRVMRVVMTQPEPQFLERIEPARKPDTTAPRWRCQHPLPQVLELCHHGQLRLIALEVA